MFHTLIVAGNLGQTPELRYTPAGQAVANLNLASNRTWTDKAGVKQNQVIWFRVTVWGRMAEVAAQYLVKGRAILVEGRLNGNEFGNPRIWTAQDGSSRASFEMTAQTLRFLPSGNGNGQAASEPEGDSFEGALGAQPGDGQEDSGEIPL